MKIINKILLLSVLMLSLTSLQASSDQVKERMLSDLNHIHETLELRYATADWKKHYLGWDLNTEIEKAKEKILNTGNITTKQFQEILAQLFNSAQDLHLKIIFHSTEESFLPFRVIPADGNYYIASVDEEKINTSVYPLFEGDQLLEFDGKPIHEAIQEVKNELVGAGETAMDYAYAARFLTTRLGAFGHKIPRGRIQITVADPFKSEPRPLQLHWTYKPEKVTNGFDRTEATGHARPALLQKCLSYNQMITPLSELLSKCKPNEACKQYDARFEMGARDSFVPALGKVWWEGPSELAFKAYMFQAADQHLIGYVRIPHYLVCDYEIEEFRKIIDFFKINADALVIDQLNNFGGDLFAAYAMASMFTDKPIITPPHRMKLGYDDVMFAIELLDAAEKVHSDEEATDIVGSKTISGLPVTYQMFQFWKEYCYFVLDHWKKGNGLTEAFYLAGFDQINPHPKTRFTKPMIVLVNELDMSGGDFFPCLMQDNGLALIVGSRTGGAGGYVRTESFHNRHGIALFSFTSSIAERMNGQKLENLGVTPDLPLEITPYDLSYDFGDYRDGILRALKLIL